ncbi:MAG: hypothetical protein ACRD0G_00590 [Acidimicrobiales bacterium]
MFQRWTNPSQPQTLQIAVMLFYIDAAFDVLFGLEVPLPVDSRALAGVLAFGFLVGKIFAGLGIANERRWGYHLALAVSVLALVPFAWFGLVEGIGELLTPQLLLNLVFPVARFALLVHPHSRDYQRIWFE